MSSGLVAKRGAPRRMIVWLGLLGACSSSGGGGGSDAGTGVAESSTGVPTTGDETVTSATSSPDPDSSSGGDSGAHDYFEDILGRPDLWKAISLRPQPGHPCSSTIDDWCGDPYFSDQLQYNDLGGFARADADSEEGLWFTFDPANDTHPFAQDATKMRIPAFGPNAQALLIEALPAGAADEVVTLALVHPDGTAISPDAPGANPLQSQGASVRIDDEILTITTCEAGQEVGCGFEREAGLLTVTRGQFGTTAAAHDANAALHRSTSTTPNPIDFPLGTADGNTYVTSWDFYLTDTFVDSGLTNHKAWNFLSPGIWLEPDTSYATGTIGCGDPTDFDGTVHAAVFKARSYNAVSDAAPADWSASNGNTLGPGVTGNQPLCPQPNTFIIHPNRWTRVWVRIQQRADDYDVLDTWIADEVQEPVRIHDGLLVSVGGSLDPAAQTINTFIYEWNTSTDDFLRNASCDPNQIDATCDLVGYHRNLFVLQAAGEAAGGTLSDDEMAALLVRPLP